MEHHTRAHVRLSAAQHLQKVSVPLHFSCVLRKKGSKTKKRMKRKRERKAIAGYQPAFFFFF